MYEEEIREAIDNNKFVILFFHSESCKNCHKLEKILDKDFSDIKMIKINIANDMQITVKYSVMLLPTILIYKNKEIISSIIGNHDCIEYLKEIFL